MSKNFFIYEKKPLGPEKKFIFLLFGICGAYIMLFYIIPLSGLSLGFKDYSFSLGINSPWNGLENFKYLLTDKNFPRVFFNTIRIGSNRSLLIIGGSFLVSLILAHIKNRRILFNTLVIILTPQFLSWVVIACIFRGIFAQEGLIRTLINQAPLFFSDEKKFSIVLYTAIFWRDSGLVILLMTFTLRSVDRDIIAAAKLDGANRLHLLLHVRLPLIRHQLLTIIIFVLLSFSSGAFEAIFNLYNPALYNRFDIMDTYIYRIGIATGRIAIGMTLEIIKSLLNLVILAILLLRFTSVVNKFNPFSLLDTAGTGKDTVRMKFIIIILALCYFFPVLVLASSLFFGSVGLQSILNPVFLRTLGVSLLTSFGGALVSTLLSLSLAYAMYWGSYTNSNSSGKGLILLTGSLFFLLLINGGVIAFYNLVNDLKLRNTIFALFVPYLVNFIFILYYLEELKKLDPVFIDMLRLDGVSPGAAFLHLNYGIKRGALLNLYCLYFISHWNNWYAGVLFIDKKELLPVNVYLRNIITFASNMNSIGMTGGYYSLHVKMAMAFFSVLPLFILIIILNHHNLISYFKKEKKK